MPYPGVVALVRECVAAGMAEHVWMRLEIEVRARSGALDHPGKARGRERGSPLADEDEGRRQAVALEPARGAHLVADQRVRARGAVLDPPHMQHRGIELDLVPTEIAGLGQGQPF